MPRLDLLTQLAELLLGGVVLSLVLAAVHVAATPRGRRPIVSVARQQRPVFVPVARTGSPVSPAVPTAPATVQLAGVPSTIPTKLPDGVPPVERHGPESTRGLWAVCGLCCDGTQIEPYGPRCIICGATGPIALDEVA